MMRTMQTLATAVILLGSVAFWPSSAWAQCGSGSTRHHRDGDRLEGAGSDQPQYNPRGERTVTGVVQEAPGSEPGHDHGSMTKPNPTTPSEDRQITLRSNGRLVYVRLAPAAFLAENSLAIHDGDTVEVTGSRVKIGASEVWLARQIRMGGSMWVLRDVNGTPLWTPSARQ